MTNDHVLLESLQIVPLTREGRFGKNARRLLERGRRDEALRTQGGLSDTLKDRLGFRRTGPLSQSLLVGLLEADFVDFLMRQSFPLATK